MMIKRKHLSKLYILEGDKYYNALDQKCGWSGWVAILNRMMEWLLDFIEKLMSEPRLRGSERTVYVIFPGKGFQVIRNN